MEEGKFIVKFIFPLHTEFNIQFSFLTSIIH